MMNMNQEYQDKIDKYLLGQMSDTESLNFEKEMAEDKDLMEQLEFTKNVKDAISGRNRRLAQIREWKEAYEAKNASEVEIKDRIAKRHYLYLVSGIAAIFIVGFFLFSPIVFNTDSSSEHPISVNVSSLRSGVDNTDIAKMINEGNYDLALVKIEEKVRKQETEKSRTEQGKDNIDEEEYSFLREVHEIQMDELSLLKAYALIGLKRSEEAMSILDGIRQRDSKFKAQADSLYHLYK